jgi:hypothetical protein
MPVVFQGVPNKNPEYIINDLVCDWVTKHGSPPAWVAVGVEVWRDLLRSLIHANSLTYLPAPPPDTIEKMFLLISSGDRVEVRYEEEVDHRDIVLVPSSSA